MRLIDANDVEYALAAICDRESGIPLAVATWLANAVRNAPTVDAAPVVHAEWENVQNGKGICSNCHRLDSIDNIATHCRYCGAKMDGDKNG